MKRICTACNQRPADTISTFPALCLACMDRAGDDITPGCRVVYETDSNCDGTVDRLEDDLVVVRTHDGGEAWLPLPEVIRVQPC